MSNARNIGSHPPRHGSVVQTVYPVHKGILPNVGLDEESKNTYIVIVNQGNMNETPEPTSSKPSIKLKKGMPKIQYKMDNIDNDNNKKSPADKSIIKDDVKLNLSDMGFEDYDSTTSAQSVFRDDCDNVQDSKLSVKLIPDDISLFQKSKYVLNVNQMGSSGPYLSPTPGSDQLFKPKTETPLTKMDLSGSSGYNSACSPFLQSTFDTPSPFSSACNKQSAAKQIFLISTSQQSNEQFSGASPISCISAGLKNVAVLHSPSEMTPIPSPGLESQSNPMKASSIQTVAINPSFLTSTPITQTLTSSRTETLTNVKPFQVRLPVIKREHISASPTFDVKDERKQQGCRKELNSSHSEVKSKKEKIERIGDVVLHFKTSKYDTSVKVDLKKNSGVVLSSEETIPSSSGVVLSSQETIPSSSQESVDSQESVVSEKESLDDSLTNIQWLKGIQLKKEVKEDTRETNGKTKEKEGTNNPIQWRYLSPADIKRIAQECGKIKRPPFSYMTLIQMALNSTEEKKMTLREICKWIETTFPFYKYTAKPGWKNSIRHNLSLYSIFEREKSKKHGSYWTMREDCPEKTKVVPANKDLKKESLGHPFGAHLASMIPLMPASFFQHSQPGLKLPLPPAGIVPAFPFNTGTTTIPVIRDPSQRKGPQPILPRPYMFGSAPMQTYALIPIQSMGQNIQMESGQNQSVTMQVPSEQTVSSLPTSSTQDKEQINIQRKLKKKKMITIAPKANPPSTCDESVNIVRQAWLDAQNLTSDSETERATNKIACKIEDKFEKISTTTVSDDSTAKKAKMKETLPKPKFYNKKTPPSKKTRSRRKQKLIPKERSLLQDSSDEETNFVANLEKELPTPLRNILDKNEVDSNTMTTSTPFKSNFFTSSQLPSPIKGLTPLKTTVSTDGMFLDYFKDSDTEGRTLFSPEGRALFSPEGRTLFSPEVIKFRKKSPSVLRTPNSSQLDLNFTPLKSINIQDSSNNGHSLSKFIADFPIDSQFIMEEGDGLPADLSNLNWSVGQAENDHDDS